VLEVADSGDAERVLKNSDQLREAAKMFLARGIVPFDDGWGGWLGRYQAAVKRKTKEMTEFQVDRRSGRVR
jgi:hypothetical protein